MKQRTIKFRGWFPEMKRMLYQDGDWHNCLEYATWSFPMNIDEGDDKRWNVNEECILMQFTGLFDKNGKEIYESDIVKYKTYFEENEVLKEVEWSDGITGFDPFADYDADCDIYVRGKDVEVIGNIYENPELLKS